MQEQNPAKCLYFRSDDNTHGYLRTCLPFESIRMTRRPDVNLEETTYRAIAENELKNMRAIRFQRAFGNGWLSYVHQFYNRHRYMGFKMVYDIDDYIFGHNELDGGDTRDGLPSYNNCYKGFTDDVQSDSLDIMRLMDTITVSTDRLGQMLQNDLGLTCKFVTIPNALPKAWYGNAVVYPWTETPQKPRVIWIGAAQHVDNENKRQGDWSDGWIEWLRKNIVDGKMEFASVSNIPFFLDDLKDKIKQLGPVCFNMYHLAIKNWNPDVCINPLIDNKFNECKSDLALLTCSALGIPCVGTVFKSGRTSPFDHAFATVLDTDDAKTIEEKMNRYLHPEKRNEIIRQQFEFMDEDGRWVESQKHQKRILDALFL